MEQSALYYRYEELKEKYVNVMYLNSGLEEKNKKLIGMLIKSKQVHFQCDDPWYSCPLSEDGCANDSDEGCTCGAEEWNNKVDELIKKQ